jgi:integrase/recombinase XerC
MFEAFLSYLHFEKRYSLHTIEAYLSDLNQFCNFIEIDSEREMLAVKAISVRSWVVEMVEKKMTNKSVNRKLATLRTYFKWLQKEGKIDISPLQKITGPKNEKRLPVFVREADMNEEKLTPLFTSDFDGQRDQMMFELFYQTGIRLSELIELKEKNIYSEHIKVLGKRNKERIIPISNKLFTQISEFQKNKKQLNINSENLFVLSSGRKLYPQFVYRRINHYLSHATNLEKNSPHVLRHTFATHMLNRGSGLETLKDLLGHASLAATQVYTHNSFAQLTSIYSQAHPRGHKS